MLLFLAGTITIAHIVRWHIWDHKVIYAVSQWSHNKEIPGGSQSLGAVLGADHICRLLPEHLPGRLNYDKEWSIVHMWSSGLWSMMFDSKRKEYLLWMLAEFDKFSLKGEWKTMISLLLWDLLGVSHYIGIWLKVVVASLNQNLYSLMMS